MELNIQDLKWAVNRLPIELTEIMKKQSWWNKIFIGGGYLISTITNQPINDIDIFVSSKESAEFLSLKLSEKKYIHKTENAYTLKNFKPAIQIIHRWVFDKKEDVANSFDFTISCAVISFDGDKFSSYIDNNYYCDLAAKRLTYRRPIRNEDAGGSLLRVLKYYQKGYRIPLDSFASVISRLMKSVGKNIDIHNEEELSFILSGLLREVDPSVDPNHIAHLPNSKDL